MYIRNFQREKHREIGVAVLIVIFVSMGVLSGLGIIDFSKLWKWITSGKEESQEMQTLEENVPKISDDYKAYQAAIEKAKEWHQDAALSFIDTRVPTSQKSRQLWKFIFSSESAGKSLEVKVRNLKVEEVNEVEYIGAGGAPMPSEGISSQDAMEKILSMPEYQNEKILSIEAVYGKGTQKWSWGIKTSKGTVSFEITP